MDSLREEAQRKDPERSARVVVDPELQVCRVQGLGFCRVQGLGFIGFRV